MKKLLKEFKEFISRGNVMDLAVGVVIGGAFGSMVGHPSFTTLAHLPGNLSVLAQLGQPTISMYGRHPSSVRSKVARPLPVPVWQA